MVFVPVLLQAPYGDMHIDRTFKLGYPEFDSAVNDPC